VPAPLRDPLGLLEEEHAISSGLLERIHGLTQGFTVSAAAHDAHRRLFETFRQLADSLRRHVYLESHVPFKMLIDVRNFSIDQEMRVTQPR
jgi:iron-sulfur cluster repair protein YtfE (RIC family)